MKLAVTSLVFCVAALLAFGMVMLYSASMAQVGAHYLVKQLLAGLVGLGLCAAAALLDYRRLKTMVWPLFGFTIFFLLLVFVPHIGIRRNGASRWIGHGGTSFFQPSEFAKLATLIALAWYGERYQRQMHTWKRGIVFPGLLIAPILGLIFKEPDVGNALLLATVSFIMLLTAGIRLRYALPPVLILILGVALFIQHNQMRSERIYSWLHVEETRREKGLQAYEAMVALGSGGVSGVGLGDGLQKLGFLPEHHTDFIFSIIGEELGVIATLLVVAAFLGIVVCGVCIAVHSCDTFGLLLGTGVTFLIGLQAFINIGVVTSALPNKGLPLPFISFGGSNLMMMLLCIGVLLSIARLSRANESLASAIRTDEDLRDPNPFKLKHAEAAA
jgi:cell division protein FtsW